jgi:hypothetical protein
VGCLGHLCSHQRRLGLWALSGFLSGNGGGGGTARKFSFELNPLKTEFLLNNIFKSSLYLTGNTLRLRYKAQLVNAVWGNSRCLLWEPYGTHIHCVGRMHLSNIYKSSPYLTGNTSRLRYKAQLVNAVWGNSRCLLWETYGTHRHTLSAEYRVLVC